MSALLEKKAKQSDKASTKEKSVSTASDLAVATKIANEGIMVTKLCSGCITKHHKVKVQLVAVQGGSAYTKYELRWQSGIKKGWRTSSSKYFDNKYLSDDNLLIFTNFNDFIVT
jgi:hypothetical protein